MIVFCPKCHISLISGHKIMIGVVVFPDFQLLDAAGPISVFEIAARFAGQPPSIKVLAVTSGPVGSSSGVEMLARGLRPSGAITTLIVAGGEGRRPVAILLALGIEGARGAFWSAIGLGARASRCAADGGRHG